MATQTLRRVEAMLEELNKTVVDYSQAKEQYDTARIAYEVAREKFASVRRLATAVLSRSDWWTWRTEHEIVQYTGLKIGEAIVEALYDCAYTSAWGHHHKNKPYEPAMTLEELQESMERGGFEFRTTAPLREVNAALIQFVRDERVVKEGRNYRLADSDEVLATMAPSEPEKVDGKTGALGFATNLVKSDEELPF